MISFYTSAFNIEENNFDILGFIKNIEELASEIVISTIPDNIDNTLEILNNITSTQCAIKIVQDVNLNSQTFAKDGKLKNLSLQNCSNDICIQIDLDERISNTKLWLDFIISYKDLILNGISIMIPVINLYKDKYHYKDISQKWYIHNKHNRKRGIVNFAILPNGKFDKNKSDGCELLDNMNNLTQSLSILSELNNLRLDPLTIIQNNKIPYIIHHGYIDLQRRASLNKNFWQKEWSNYSNDEVNLPINIQDFSESYYQHYLNI